MTVYFAQTGDRYRFGGFVDCVAWAAREVERNQSRIVRVSRMRAGEPDACLLAEITRDGVRFLDGRLKTTTRGIRRLAHNGR